MQREHVNVIAPPVHASAVRGEYNAGDVVDRTRRSVLARNPLRQVEGEPAGLNRDYQLRVDDLARRIGQIDADLDGPVGFVSLRKNSGARQNNTSKDVFQLS